VITLKQMEALCEVARLGSFERAAARLHTTQSAISKRIQEVESALGAELFDRSRRTARLTAKGEEVRVLAEETLAARDRLIEAAARKEAAPRRFRLGVTELTAMTWLPRLVQEVRTAYPDVLIEPQIGPGATLYEQIMRDELDLIVAPELRERRGITTVSLGDVQNAWMCAPSIAPRRQVLPLAEIGRFTLLVQGGGSAVGKTVDSWLRSNGVRARKVVSTNNLVALAGLTLSGLGVSYMPREYFDDLVRSGALEVVRTDPSLPPFSFVAAYQRDRPSTVHAFVAETCRRVCDFTTPYGRGLLGAARRKTAAPR
jgi:DNA-binding transcriptional LysR family regulator